MDTQKQIKIGEALECFSTKKCLIPWNRCTLFKECVKAYFMIKNEMEKREQRELDKMR